MARRGADVFFRAETQRAQRGMFRAETQRAQRFFHAKHAKREAQRTQRVVCSQMARIGADVVSRRGAQLKRWKLNHIDHIEEIGRVSA
jgi:hypothetical protein